MRRAGSIVVDDRKAACAGGGDVVDAAASGASDASRVPEHLRDLACGIHPGRGNAAAIAVFESVGFAPEDPAAAEAACAAALVHKPAVAAQGAPP